MFYERFLIFFFFFANCIMIDIIGYLYHETNLIFKKYVLYVYINEIDIHSS